MTSVAAANRAPTRLDKSKAEFSVTSRLVLVDVVVRKDGQPICGLKQPEFELREDGKPQNIQSVVAHCAGDARPTKLQIPPLPPHTYTNLPTAPVTSSVNVLLLDGLNTRARDEMRARQEMIQSLRTMPPGERIAIFTLGSRLRMLAGFTSDTSVLLKALAGTKPLTHSMLPPEEEKADEEQLIDMLPGYMQADMRGFLDGADNQQTGDRIAATLTALQSLARYLAGIPGRKNLLWLSGSFPIETFSSLPLPDGFREARVDKGYDQQVRKTARLLSEARVAVYPIDVRGLIAEPIYSASQMRTIDIRDTLADQQRDAIEQIAQRDTLRSLARETGGRAIYESNDLANAMNGAIEDGSDYYTLSYVPRDAKFNGAWRSIRVSLSTKPAKGKYDLYYRDGYFALANGEKDEAVAANSPQDTFAAAMRQGMPAATQILFDVRVTARTGGATKGNIADGNAQLKDRAARYLLDYAAAVRDLDLAEGKDGSHTGELVVYAAAFNRAGLVVNRASDAFRYRLNAEQWKRASAKGLQIHQQLDLPAGDYTLRLGLYDPVSGHIGTLEIPLRVSE